MIFFKVVLTTLDKINSRVFFETYDIYVELLYSGVIFKFKARILSIKKQLNKNIKNGYVAFTH